MATPPHCKKRNYRNREAALRAVDRLQEKNVRRSARLRRWYGERREKSVYFCRYGCNRWHTTSLEGDTRDGSA